MVPRRLWVARLSCSRRVANKIVNSHGIEIDEIRDHVVCPEGLLFWWDDDPELRVFVELWLRRRRVVVCLYVDDSDPFGDAYHLASAYPDV